MPLDSSAPSHACVRCHAPAIAEAWFAKSY
jgi:hypothetical protein